MCFKSTSHIAYNIGLHRDFWVCRECRVTLLLLYIFEEQKLMYSLCYKQKDILSGAICSIWYHDGFTSLNNRFCITFSGILHVIFLVFSEWSYGSHWFLVTRRPRSLRPKRFGHLKALKNSIQPENFYYVFRIYSLSMIVRHHDCYDFKQKKAGSQKEDIKKIPGFFGVLFFVVYLVWFFFCFLCLQVVPEGCAKILRLLDSHQNPQEVRCVFWI